MIRFIIRRVCISIVLLALVSVIIFVVLRILPGDPTEVLASRPGTTAAQVAQERRQLGLDAPIFVQYIRWIGGAIHGDLGRSYFSDYSATQLVGQRIGPTVELALLAVLLSLVIAIPLGLITALRPRSFADRGIRLYASMGIAMPVFWLGLLLVLLFSLHLGWLPSRGYASLTSSPGENLKLIILPAVTLAIVIAAPIIRFLSASLTESLTSDYVRTARGKGLLWHQVVFRHAYPNSLLPTLNFVGIVAGSLLGGIAVIEWMFGWPGLGALAVDSIFTRDYAVLQALVLLAAAAFIATTLVVDLITMVLDPRLRMTV